MPYLNSSLTKNAEPPDLPEALSRPGPPRQPPARCLASALVDAGREDGFLGKDTVRNLPGPELLGINTKIIFRYIKRFPELKVSRSNVSCSVNRYQSPGKLF